MSTRPPETAHAHRQRRRRLAWGLAGGAALLLLAWMVFGRLRGQEVPAVVVEPTSLSHRVVVSGRVTPPSQIQVGAMISAPVVDVKVEEGDVVEPGAPLVELEAAELEAAVAQAEASLLQARAGLAQLLRVTAPAQAEAVRQAELAADQAQKKLQRFTTLAEAGSVSEEQLEEARNAQALAESRLATARTQATATGKAGVEVRAAQAQVAQAEAQLQAARARRAQATLTSPVKAQVLLRSVEPGDAVSPGRTLLLLARVGPTRLSVEPDEKNLAFLKPGQKALASADAFPQQRFEATVESVAPSVNPERGTVEVKLRVPNPPDYLRPDMTVSVEIAVAQKDDTLVIPTDAVKDADKEAPWVLVAEDGRARRVDVKLGLTGQGRVEVVEGLTRGQTVLLPQKPLEAGARVRPALPAQGD